VDSACVVLIRRAQPLLPENQHAAFVKIVKRAFSQRRKMMLKLLAGETGGRTGRRKNWCPETDAEFVWVYRCQAEGPFQLHPDEIERGGWFAPEKITRWIAEKPGDFAGAFRLIWELFLTAKTPSVPRNK
jgi:hypothetical protein